MLDRASTFADPKIVTLLKTRFIPVAIDQAYQRRQKDAEGEFYRKIASQGPRSNFQGTTQGLYVASADGKFLGYSNNRTPERIQALLKKALNDFQPKKVAAITAGELDPKYNPAQPVNGLVVAVRAKILGGYEKTDNQWQKIFQNAMSRDNLWITRQEKEALLQNQFPLKLQKRIARFHLIDNTRGEPPMWSDREIRKLDLQLDDGKISGTFLLETDDKSRGFEGEIVGHIKMDKQRVPRFDAVAKGEFWGNGRYTQNAPSGRFPIAISFTFVDGQAPADRIPPQGSRGWVNGYLKN